MDGFFTVCHCYCEGVPARDRTGESYCPDCGGLFLKNRFKSIKSSCFSTNESTSPRDCLQALRMATCRKWTPLELG
jgi:hypothetical protein